MIETVCDLKIGDEVTTQISPMSQKYMYELDCEKERYGEDSEEYQVAKKDYDDIWGERSGTLIKIGECFAECVLKTDDDKEIPMFYPMIGNYGHWRDNYVGGGKFFIHIELKK